MHFYAPSWFQIKTHPTCTDGPKNYFKMVQNARKLGKSLQKVVQKVLQRNAYFAHPEAILLLMLADSNGDIRAQAVNAVLTIRMNSNNSTSHSRSNTLLLDDRGVDEIDDDNELSDDEEAAFTLEPSEADAISSSTIRKYRLPKINFMADSYVQLIDWEESVLSEPPLTLPKTDAEVSAFRDVAFQVPKYPCHTQAVERAICIVSEASTAVVGQEARNGYIRQRITARKELPKFETKKEYYPKIEAQSL